MAQPLFSPETLDFGIIPPGTQKSLYIEFVNISSPSASVDVTISLFDAVFSFNESSFTLAANGDTKTVTATYTPLSVQVDDDTWRVTHDGSQFPASPFDFEVTAECGSPFTEYALPDIENRPAGTMKVSLFLESDVAAPTIPSAVKVVHIGELVELIDVNPGIVDIQNLEIELAEDYTTYSEGFWYHVIQSDPDRRVQFRFILDEDGTDTFYFWGEVYRQEVRWPEYYINTAETDIRRTVTLKLVSLIHSLTATTVQTTINELSTHESAISGLWTIKSILSSILTGLVGQAYDVDNVHIRSTDIRLFETDLSTVVAVEDALVLGVQGSPFTVTRGYFDTPAVDANRNHWVYRYANPFELLRALCLNFGWIARYFYGQSDGTYAGDSTDRHRLEFLTRGNSYATLVTPEKGIQESTLSSDTVNKTVNVRVQDIPSANETVSTNEYDLTSGYSWFGNGRENRCSPAFAADPWDVPNSYRVTEPPPGINFDMDIVIDFRIANWPTPPSGGIYPYQNLIYDNGAGAGEGCDRVGYYDYSIGDWDDTIDTMQTALMLYYSRRFTPGRKMFERLYGGLRFTESGTTSHTVMKPMKMIEIDDQISSVNYYATEIRKDFEANTTTVLWIEA